MSLIYLMGAGDDAALCCLPEDFSGRTIGTAPDEMTSAST